MKKYWNVVLLAFVWGAYYYSLGYSNKEISPFATGVFIRAITFVILTITLLLQGKLKTLLVPKKFLPKLILIGCLGFLLDITAFFGSRYGNPAIGSILLKTDVVMVCILSAIIYKKGIAKKEWGIIAIMLVGVALVLGLTPEDFTIHVTDLFYVASALFVSLNAFVIKSAQKDHVPSLVIAFYNNFVTMICFIAAMFIMNVQGDMAAGLQSPVVIAALVIGGLGQFFVYIFYYKALGELPVWIVKVILLLIPIITLIYAFLFTGKLPTGLMLLGTAIVLLSAMALLKLQQKQSEGLTK